MIADPPTGARRLRRATRRLHGDHPGRFEMARGALDYSRVARIYDDYCVFDADVAFFRNILGGCRGAVLELMAGTGRLSLPLAAGGTRLTCVDSSLAMLALLQRKLDGAALTANLVCADVCDTTMRGRFDRVLLPFQGLTELASHAQRSALFRSVADLLAADGEFVCTTHNPVVRRRSVDGNWHEVGEFARSDGGVLRVALRCAWDEGTRNVVGEQKLTIEGGSGDLEELTLDLRFSLVGLEELHELAKDVSLRVVSVRGDYAGAAYDPATSPVIIATLRRSA